MNASRTLAIGTGVAGILAGLSILVQIPAANQYHETTLSAAGVAVLLLLFGVRTVVETEGGSS